MTATTTRRYLFAPLERRGVLLGLVPSQVVSIAASLALAVLVVQVRADAFGILGGLLTVTLGALGAFVPLAGRPPLAWLPVVAPWLRRRRRGAALNPAPVAGRPLFPAVPGPPTGAPGGEARALSPRPGPSVLHTAPWSRADGSRSLAGGVEILAAPAEPGQPELGVVRDRLTGAMVAALPVRGGAFALADPVDKERRLAAWGSVLAGLSRAGSPVDRVQWVERASAGNGAALRRYLEEAAVPPGLHDAVSPNPAEAARRSYAELIAGAGGSSLEHECLVVLAVHPRRAGRAPRGFGRGEQALMGLLRREVRLLQGQLRGAELAAADPLDPAGLAAALRAGFEPGARGPLGPGGAWPLATAESWSSLRTDGAWHATYWVAEWPRVEVGPDFLAPLLLGGARRTVSVTFAPVAPERARRQAESARTAGVADEELRRRAGFLPTAKRSREAEGIAQREAELADGHAELRFSGYVAVTGPDPEALEAACAEVEALAQQARLELRRLYGQQRDAFTWTLPLARGLA